MRYVLVLSLMISFPSLVHGGDEATLHFIGFSPDGQYLAFEQFGWYDGSGFPYSEIVFVNVPKNSFVCTPILVSLDEDEWDESARDRAREHAHERFLDLGIIEGNTGYHLKTQARHEPDIDPHFVRLSGSDLPLDSLGKYFQYAVRLTEIEYDIPDDLPLAYGPPQMLELSIEAPDILDPLILQRDSELPSRRANVLSYHISDVYLYRHEENTYIAVFISYMQPGFEGPDFRYMVVTGSLP